VLVLLVWVRALVLVVMVVMVVWLVMVVMVVRVHTWPPVFLALTIDH